MERDEKQECFETSLPPVEFRDCDEGFDEHEIIDRRNEQYFRVARDSNTEAQVNFGRSSVAVKSLPRRRSRPLLCFHSLLVTPQVHPPAASASASAFASAAVLSLGFAGSLSNCRDKATAMSSAARTL
jgi:hypothetical protein